MNAIGVFFDTNQVKDSFFVQMFRQGKLHEDAMHSGIGVQCFHQRFDGFLRRILRQVVRVTLDADTLGGAHLHADVHLRSWILSDQHHAQSRCIAVFCLKFSGVGGDFFA